MPLTHRYRVALVTAAGFVFYYRCGFDVFGVQRYVFGCEIYVEIPTVFFRGGVSCRIPTVEGISFNQLVFGASNKTAVLICRSSCVDFVKTVVKGDGNVVVLFPADIDVVFFVFQQKRDFKYRAGRKVCCLEVTVNLISRLSGQLRVGVEGGGIKVV